jgi:hypothetical protein
MVTEQDAFRIGFCMKLAELKINPQQLNDAIEVTQKIGSVMLPLAIGAGVFLPSIIDALVKAGVGIPAAMGSMAGAGVAEMQADAVDPSKEEVMKRKILNDFKAQIRKANAESDNSIISGIVQQRKNK